MKKKKMDVYTEGLAVPEIHVSTKDEEDENEKNEGITFDNLAFPEIHTRKKK